MSNYNPPPDEGAPTRPMNPPPTNPQQPYQQPPYQQQPYQQPYRAPQTNNLGSAQATFRPAPKPNANNNNDNTPRSSIQPTYHPVGISASSMERGERNNSNSSFRR